jgi:hypothetical protein
VASGKADVSELEGVVGGATTTKTAEKEESPVASQASQSSSPEDGPNQR